MEEINKSKRGLLIIDICVYSVLTIISVVKILVNDQPAAMIGYQSVWAICCWVIAFVNYFAMRHIQKCMEQSVIFKGISYDKRLIRFYVTCFFLIAIISSLTLPLAAFFESKRDKETNDDTAYPIVHIIVTVLLMMLDICISITHASMIVMYLRFPSRLAEN